MTGHGNRVRPSPIGAPWRSSGGTRHTKVRGTSMRGRNPAPTGANAIRLDGDPEEKLASCVRAMA